MSYTARKIFNKKKIKYILFFKYFINKHAFICGVKQYRFEGFKLNRTIYKNITSVK